MTLVYQEVLEQLDQQDLLDNRVYLVRKVLKAALGLEEM